MRRTAPLAPLAALLLIAGCAGDGSPQPSGQFPPGPDRAPRLGVSLRAEAGGGYAGALARSEDQLGRIQVARVFFPGPPAGWPDLGADPGAYDLVVSFKLDPAEVLSGRWDQQMRQWFASAPAYRRIYWTLWHEPEDDIQQGRFSAADFRRAVAHLDRLADRSGPRQLRTTVILMSFTARGGQQRRWQDYVPPAESYDLLAWDAYNRSPDYADPAALIGPSCRINAKLGKPFAVAELGSVLAPDDDGTKRARWLTELGSELRRCRARFVAYFDKAWDGGAQDFRLRDAPSLRAWRTLGQARPDGS